MKAKRIHRKNYNDFGDAHELTFSCYRRLPLLTKDRTRNWLVDSINDAREKLDFDLWAYAIMPEHVHLIVHPRAKVYDIASIKCAIKEPVGRKALAYLRKFAPEWIKNLTRTRGARIEHLFWQSGGGYDRNIESGKALLRMIDYFHMNPVRRGLVARPEDWEWSSARWYAGRSEWLLRIDSIPASWLDMKEG